MRYKVGAESKVQGKLKPADRERHEREAKKYAKVLRMVKAQSASELMQWFVQRWDGLLDQPEENDRTTRRAELFFDELLLLLLGTWLAVSHLRMLIVFGILAAPILSRQLATSWEDYDALKDRIWPNAVMIAASLLGIWLAFPSSRNLEEQVKSQSPVRAVEFIQAHHLSGPMLNSYGFGGYLIWAAPQYPVFIDGRTDIYEWSGVLREFNRWSTLQSDPNELLKKYKIAFCLLDRNSAMARVLPLLHEWKAVYSDSNSVIFIR